MKSTRTASSTGAAGTDRYDGLSRALHWIFAIGILYASAVGYALAWIDDHAVHDFLSHLNMSLATVLIALFPLRLGWRLLRREPPAPAIPPGQQRLARAVQILLYATICVVLVSGFLMVPHGYSFFGLVGIPTVFEKGPVTEGFFLLHRISCAVLVALFALHIAGVLKNTVVNRVNILSRMT